MLFYPSLQQIAIVRALPGLGDLLCAVPAWRALRAAFPNAHISLIGLPIAQSFVDRFYTYLDQWLPFPGYPGIPEGWQGAAPISAFFAQIQQQFDLALQMHGNGSYINGFTVLLGAKHTAGFYLPGSYCPDVDTFLPYPNDQPEVQRHLELMSHLGIPAQGEFLEFPLTTADRQDFHTLNLPASKPYICLHPGASVSDRRWSVSGFAQAADMLAQRGYSIILTGTRTEQNLTKTIAAAMRYPAFDLAGQTSLGALAILLQQASLLICNDTGVSHLAAAVKTRSVVVFSNSELHRWAPLDRDRHHPIQHHGSTTDTLSAVLAAADRLLAKTPAHV